ncbi:dihydrofolate reductase family protein [Flavobacterium sp. 3HN19-14]|uniref:dihydrofolate reductase family protein n=1 Tax=Flavobacterium sp. 3HN19-14 TaxID=3448133 RepID=UPI003EE06435
MRKLTAYNFLSLNGYYKGIDNDISWNRHGQEENEFASENSQAESVLVFGRITYEMMAGFWQSEQANQQMPAVADGMNKSEKIVFSNTLNEANWKNTTLIKGDMIESMKKLKATEGKDMTILGSGSIITQFAEHNLIDVYQFMVNPVALGNGTAAFSGLPHKLDLKLISSRVFKSGVVLLNYEPLDKE